MKRFHHLVFTYTFALLAFFATSALAQGPVALLGIDAEDAGHPAPANYVTLMGNIYTTANNGGSGTLVIGGGKNAVDRVTTFWNALTTTIGPITYVNGAANIASASFLGYRMIAVVSDVVNTPSGGLTNAENEALTARAAGIAGFINGGGGLIGFSSVDLTTPYGYLGSLGTFTFGTPPQQSNITPTVEGLAVGVTNALDGCCWHDSYLTFPNFLDVLAYYPSVTGAPAAAIGGQQVIVATNCPYSQGFWKTHGMNSCQVGNNVNFWPANAFPMLLGSNPYDASQACSILHTQPQGGNALVSLAHQLIAAKLNIANGSAAPAPVPATIIAADALIGALDVETAVVRSNTAEGQQMNSLAAILDLFNNNMIQPVCVPTGASPKRGITRPDEFMAQDIRIEGNYPNPVTDFTNISYAVETDGHAVLAIYNTLGSRVRVLVDREVSAGSYDVQWNGRDAAGDALPSGQYFIRLMMNEQMTSAPFTIAR